MDSWMRCGAEDVDPAWLARGITIPHLLPIISLHCSVCFPEVQGLLLVFSGPRGRAAGKEDVTELGASCTTLTARPLPVGTGSVVSGY